jgi:hypothetical protein
MKHAVNCLGGTYNPSTHDPYMCTCGLGDARTVRPGSMVAYDTPPRQQKHQTPHGDAEHDSIVLRFNQLQEILERMSGSLSCGTCANDALKVVALLRAQVVK